MTDDTVRVTPELPRAAVTRHLTAAGLSEPSPETDPHYRAPAPVPSAPAVPIGAKVPDTEPAPAEDHPAEASDHS